MLCDRCGRREALGQDFIPILDRAARRPRLCAQCLAEIPPEEVGAKLLGWLDQIGARLEDGSLHRWLLTDMAARLPSASPEQRADVVDFIDSWREQLDDPDDAEFSAGLQAIADQYRRPAT